MHQVEDSNTMPSITQVMINKSTPGFKLNEARARNAKNSKKKPQPDLNPAFMVTNSSEVFNNQSASTSAAFFRATNRN